MRWFRSGLLLTTCALSACSLAPAYHPPHFILPASYQGAGGFTVATPEDAIKRGSWWQGFRDPTLDRLEQQAAERNPDLALAAAQYLRSRDLAAEAAAGLYPDLGTSAGVSDNKQSVYRLFRGNPRSMAIESSNVIEATASWEPDFWGEIRNRVRAQKNVAQATAAEQALVQLSLQAEVADDYFALRGLDDEVSVYTQAISGYQQALTITEMRLKDSLDSGLNVARAESQLASAQAQLTQTQADRAVMLHAIADLVGVSASSFSLPPQDQLSVSLPAVPVSVPAQLLQRRPDIAQAERSDGSGEPQHRRRARGLLSERSDQRSIRHPGQRFQSPQPAEQLVVGGGFDCHAAVRRRVERRRPAGCLGGLCTDPRPVSCDRSCSFQDVEDELTLTQKLSTEGNEQEHALAAAERAQSLSLTLYTGGLSDYLNVVVAQEMALEADIATVEVQTAQLQACVNLIRALGGGWSTEDLPPVAAILPGGPLQAGGVPSAKALESPAVDNLTGALAHKPAAASAETAKGVSADATDTPSSTMPAQASSPGQL